MNRTCLTLNTPHLIQIRIKDVVLFKILKCSLLCLPQAASHTPNHVYSILDPKLPEEFSEILRTQSSGLKFSSSEGSPGTRERGP